METQLDFFFCDVENKKLYRLSKKYQGKLLRDHPDWTDYDVEDERLLEVLAYFQTKGKEVASPQYNNLFIGLPFG